MNEQRVWVGQNETSAEVTVEYALAMGYEVTLSNEGCRVTASPDLIEVGGWS